MVLVIIVMPFLLLVPYLHTVNFNLLVDINECFEETGACSQICENSVGNYTCKCSDGYKKQADGHTCKKTDSKAMARAVAVSISSFEI